MVLNLNNSGKYLSKDWNAKRQSALRDLDQRDRLTTYEKDWLELSDIQIGKYDPERTYKRCVTGEGKSVKIKNKNYTE